MNNLLRRMKFISVLAKNALIFKFRVRIDYTLEILKAKIPCGF